MNPAADALVAIISGATGLFCLGMAWWDVTWFFELPRAAWLVSTLGKVTARWVVAGIGVGLIVLGVIIQLGIRPSYATSTNSAPAGILSKFTR